MKNLWLVFVVGAVLSWGAYVPTIHHGQLGFGTPKGPFRAFLCVGLAYFLLAVLVPGAMLLAGAEPARFPGKGLTVSTLAGALGALGALCVIFALKNGGNPLYVAPLVFAGAPIVNVILSMIWDHRFKPSNPLFYVGILLAAVGAGLVLRYKPETGPPAPPAVSASPPAASPAGPNP
ncbi:MAG: hypothetical protein L6R00_04865 [Phycisphaerae bacterium]|nr:hypothetical protein [Phycisphaerae bacterium]